jgi:type II secretory pathway component PulF
MSVKTLFNYTSQLSRSLNAALPINRALEVLARTAPTRHLRTVSRDVKRSIASGSTLTQAYEKHRRIFPSFFTKMIGVGERTGKLEAVTDSLASYYEHRYEINRAMKKELVPILIYFWLLMMLVLAIERILGGPGALQKYLDVSAWAALLALSLGSAYYFFPRFRAALGSLLFDLPFIGRLVRKFCLSRFSEGMRLASEAGLDINSAIKLSSESSGNSAFQKRALRAMEYIEKGSSISEALDKTGVFSFEAIQMFIVGEETGKLHDAMGHVSKHSREDALTTLHITMVMGVRAFYVLGILYFAYKIVTAWSKIYGGWLSG